MRRHVLAVLVCAAACSHDGPPTPLAGDLTGDVAEGCVRLVRLGSRSYAPSVVSVLAAAEGCADGRPVAGLTTADLRIAQDGEALSGDVHRDLLPLRAVRHYVTLLLDLGEATRPVKAGLIEGARRFVRAVLDGRDGSVRIGVAVFDGGAEPIPWQLPLADPERLDERLAELATFGAPDTSARNLHGALREGVDQLLAWQDRVAANAEGGVLTAGHLVLFAMGEDTAGREAGSRAQFTVRAAREPADGPSVTTWGLTVQDQGLASDTLTLLVGGEAPDGGLPYVVAAADGSGLPASFAELAGRVSGRIDATLPLALCAPARAGEHVLSLAVTGQDGSPGPRLEVAYAADGFVGGCHSTFFGHACDGVDCGGFVCGACDDEAATCQEGRCVAVCDGADPCGADEVVHPLGYPQACDFPPGMERCDDLCTDLLSDDDNCGFCGLSCAEVAAGSRCQGGGCRCSDGRSVCAHRCVDLQAELTHCGECDRACDAASQTCDSGECVCRDGDTDADGVCDGADPDDDGDGCPDADDPAPLLASADADGDGAPDACDACRGDNASGDRDRDGVCDDVDGDDDGDGCADLVDVAPLVFSPDSDGDEVADHCDRCPGDDDGEDGDGDGVPDGCDACDGDDGVGDTDGDGECDDRDDDDDDDGCVDRIDDDPLVAGGDADGDGRGDDCDPCFGEDDPACVCGADGYEPNESWQVAVRPANRIADEVEVLDELTLMEGDADFFAFSVPPPMPLLGSLRVSVRAEPAEQCQGDDPRVCLEVSVYLSTDDLLDFPPSALGGAACGLLSSGIETPMLTAGTAFQEEWMLVVVHVRRDGDPPGPAPYRLHLTH